MEKVLLVGCGYIGNKILSAIQTEMDVTVVDRDRNKIKEIVETENVHPIFGDVIDRDFVAKLFKKKYDFVVAVTDSDKTNILLSTMAKKKGAAYTIASIVQKDSVEQVAFLKESLGIDNMYNVAMEMSDEVKKIVKDNLRYQSDLFGKGRIEVVGHSVDVGNFVGRKIKEIGELATLLVVGISRDSDVIVPNGETVIEPNDYLYIMGLNRDIINFKSINFSLSEKTLKRLLIVGANELSMQIAEVMNDYSVTIVDEDSEKIKRFRNKFSNVYLNEDHLKGGEFFKNFKHYDTVIVTTEDDELNIVLGLISKKMGFSQTLVKVSDISYYNILDELEFSAILNPSDVMANRIIKKLRADRGISSYMVFGNKAEVSEYRVKDDSELIGKRLMDLKAVDGMLIGGIIRADTTAVIPRGRTTIERGDMLIVFSKIKSRDEVHKFLGYKKNFGIFR